MLLLFNYLRIVSEAQPPSSYLNNLLSGNPKWLEMAAQLEYVEGQTCSMALIAVCIARALCQ
jgi:hypothetical protein